METKGKKKEREGKKSDHPELRRIVKGLLAATGEEEQVQLLQQIEKKLLTGYRIRVGSLGIEPLVLEAYYYHETHFADANTHRAPEQKEWDQLYRHCKKADMDPSGRTGGVDLCLACQEDGEEHFTVVFSHESKELPNRSRFFRLHNQPPFRPQKMQGGYCNFKGPVLKFELRCNITV